MDEAVANACKELKAALDGAEHGFYGTMQLIRLMNELVEDVHHTVPAAALPALAKIVAAVSASKP